MITLILFWVCIVLAIYIYFGYPIIITLLARLFNKPFAKQVIQPTVTLLIAAYNEEAVIEKKLKNALALDYPKLKIILMNDGSTDNTLKVAKKFKKVTIFTYNRLSKNGCINKTIKKFKSDLVIFSDANSMYNKNAIKHLVKNFADPLVGCVCGQLKYQGKSEEGLYWKYEHFIKLQEAKLGQLITANGSIFAIRRKLFKPLNPKIANDFQSPNDVAIQGYYTIFESKAIAYEKVEGSNKNEFKRKTRIIARGFEFYYNYLHRMRGLRLFILLSHKLIRLFMLPILIIIFITNFLILTNSFYNIILLLQLIFYVSAALNLTIKSKPFSISGYFMMVNFAAMVGFFRFIFRTQKATWKTLR
jgi:poly-beta-1,6-N-acetyl-D-glucosamine synthase